jgi:RNA polymerase sigma-B factor
LIRWFSRQAGIAVAVTVAYIGTLADYLGEEDPRMEHMLSMQAVATHWGELPAREQKILLMHFRGGMTQAEIGRQLRIPQAHVSRLLAHALGYLHGHA